MTEQIKSDLGPQKQTGGPHAMLRGLIALLVVAIVALVGFFGYTKLKPGGGETGSQQVGMLDREAIYALPEFLDAKKQIEAKDADFRKTLEAEVAKARAGGKQPDAATVAAVEKMRQDMAQQLQMEQNKILKPLYDRVTAAIATLAKEKGLKVVLDKKIVVTGVTDITEDVKKLFQEKKDLKLPEDSPEGESHVGYVNQSIIAELRIFKEANAELLKDYEKLGQQYATEAAKLNEADREKLRAQMIQTFQERQVELLKPVNEKVSGAITTVAKEKGLSLVLDNNHVMWGGRNLTDDVIKKLIGPADQSKS